MSASCLARLYILLVGSLVGCLNITTVFGQEKFDVLELIDAKQAIVIRIDHFGNLANELSDLDFFQHPSYLEVRDYLQTESFSQLMEAAQIPWAPNPNLETNEATVAWEKLCTGSITIAIRFLRSNQIAWSIDFPTRVGDFGSLVKSIGHAMGYQTESLLEQSVVKDYEGIGIHSVPTMPFFAFLWEHHWFVCSDLKTAQTLIDRSQGRDIPPRPFSTNRKFVAGLNQASTVNGTTLAQVFIDPELCRQFLPSIPQEFFDIAGLPEISGVFIEVNRPQNLKTNEAKAQLSMDAWIGVRMPPRGLVETLFDSPGITELPDIPIENPLEILAVRVDSIRIFESLIKQMDEVSGETGLLQNLISTLEKSEGLKSGFVETVVKGLSGQFLSILSKDLEKAPILICDTRDRQSISEIIPQVLSKQNSFGLTPDQTTTEGVDYWLWNEEKLEVLNKRLTMEIRRGQPDFEPSNLSPPMGLSLSDNYLSISISNTIESLGEIQKVKPASMPFAGDLLECLLIHDKNLIHPSLIWITSPEYWKTYVATMNYYAAHDASKTTLLEMTNLADSREQIVIRLANAACDTLGQIIVVGKAEGSGFRFSMLLFAPTQ